jgi:hypothetical protein
MQAAYLSDQLACGEVVHMDLRAGGHQQEAPPGHHTVHPVRVLQHTAAAGSDGKTRIGQTRSHKRSA